MTVIEFRQYVMQPRQRDVLIDLFEREFVSGQEEVGMTILGQFRVADDAHAFVWMRAFADMEARRRALTDFYDGECWARHRDEANATMIDVSNVLLLTPEGPGFADSDREHDGAMVAIVAPRGLDPRPDVGGEPAGSLVSLDAENTFPRLPIREGEDVRVTFHRFPAADAALTACKRLRDVEHLVLLPTEASRLR